MTTQKKVNKTNDYNKTIIPISENEIKKHKDFLKTELKKISIKLFWIYIIFQNQFFHLFLHL